MDADRVVMDTDRVVLLLASHLKIDRDKGVHELEGLMGQATKSEAKTLEAILLGMFVDLQGPWEVKHGALMGSQVILKAQGEIHFTDEFAEELKEIAIKLLDHEESRIRLCAGEVMGVLCSSVGPSVYQSVRAIVHEGVRSNLERQIPADGPQEEQDLALVSKFSDRQTYADAQQIFHDTAGWKSLETWMKCLQYMIDGCGENFISFIDQELLSLVFTCLSHTNRFVRETGYYVCASLITCHKGNTGTAGVLEEHGIYRNGVEFSRQLAKGLADNWSQVRLASSVATRKFILNLPEGEPRKAFMPTLLPALCLNRYYVAEGVRIYNQDTWRLIAGEHGKQLVEEYIDHVVNFYVLQSDADNHAVREAACACIAELGSKVDQTAVKPYVTRLLNALVVCFRDDSWPVRDASCIACGNFIKCFPEESKTRMHELYPLFYDNLQDPIASVRQGAAIALANVARAYGQEAADGLVEKVKSGLQGVEQQAENTEKYAVFDKSPAEFGVVKRLRDNDMDLHTDQQMYSCGSLAPKMHKGSTRAGGCMDHKFRKASEPWELADGCIILLAELSHVPGLQSTVAGLLTTLAATVNFRHYTQHVVVVETLCKQLPRLAKGLGKQAFKQHLELFYDAIFYGLSSEVALTSAAASQCLSDLGTFLGPNILRGRVEMFNANYLELLDSHVIPQH